ncbi:transmembrane protein 256 homolog [Anopheles aquasalis]|uniref:transmembrane protein 256 homolog n=1 Tax=Anopheles aquasalis TaxID=42839 RepID=UPI00215AF446|nr:transmembrane protein 256 homolog [Anopheles aquasalis]
MGLNDAFNYVLFNNPVSSTMWGIAANGAKAVGLKPKAVAQTAAAHTTTAVAQQALPPLWKMLGHNRQILRLAGLSGATAVMLGAYGAHYHFVTNDDEDRDPRQIFDMTNRYHFLHSIALLAAPLARRLLPTAALMTAGMSMFCGTCYYIAFTNDRRFAKFTPFGGFLLIFGWLSFAI